MKSLHPNSMRLAWRSLPMPLKGRLKPHLQTAISVLLRQCGFGFVDFEGLLKHIRANGFSPEMIIDVGAFVGDWSRDANRIFPSAQIVMIEGNEENRQVLTIASKEIPNSEFEIAVLGPEKKSGVAFYVNSQGSSVLPELTSFNQEKKFVPMLRLDDLMENRPSSGPILLKLDVQGFELEVLRGAPSTLAKSEVVIIESSLLPYNDGSPLVAEVVSFLAGSGFAVYDFCGQHRRESDGALYQTDIVFAKLASQLRLKRKFWLSEV